MLDEKINQAENQVGTMPLSVDDLSKEWLQSALENCLSDSELSSISCDVIGVGEGLMLSLIHI